MFAVGSAADWLGVCHVLIVWLCLSSVCGTVQINDIIMYVCTVVVPVDTVYVA